MGGHYSMFYKHLDIMNNSFLIWHLSEMDKLTWNYYKKK